MIEANDPHFDVPEDADVSQIVIWDATMPEFTREDVTTLRKVAEAWKAEETVVLIVPEVRKAIEVLESLADRIESLLPAEGE